MPNTNPIDGVEADVEGVRVHRAAVPVMTIATHPLTLR